MQIFKVIIPVRYSSSRLPGKALIDIAGKPMVQHVYERALKSGATSVVIATDDKRIYLAAEKFGAKACMTSEKHQSGSDRLAEAIDILGYSDNEIIVNVQGDEPLIEPKIIAQVALDLAQHQADVATVCEPLQTAQQLFDPNVVKVVRDAQGFALYFSRAPIPYDRDNFALADTMPINVGYYHHIGLYAARVNFWRKYVAWQPCVLEKIEHLEQLRVLWHGGKIFVGVSNYPSVIGVDTPEDLEKVRKML